ncbi:oligosaccharide flippase family protein [Bacteroides clarus]|uniref:oligosaccharide flippase family protein n=1 Tax=Bacteroides clarus TaxID=626929 RepID=UPI003A845AB9
MPLIYRIRKFSEYIYKYKTLVENFGYLTLLQICNLLIPLITYPYLINTLGKDLYGVIIYSQAIVSYLSIFVNWGFNISATKSISINRDNPKKVNEIASVVYLVKSFLLIIVFGVLFLMFVFPEIHKYKLLYILSMWQCVYECLFPVWFFQGIEKMKYIAIFSFVGRLVFVLLIFLCVATPEDYLLVPLINGIGAIITSFIAIYILLYRFNIKLTWQSFATVYSYTKDSTKLLLTSITGIIKDKTNTIVIGSVLGMGEVAYYDFVEKIVNVLSTVFYTISNVVFPYYNKNANRLFARKLLICTTLSGILLYILVGCFLKQFILLFFNDEMLVAIPVYWILGTLFIYRHLSYFLGTVILISHNHVKDVIMNMFYSMFVYLFIVIFFWIIGYQDIYILSISLVVSVLFEAWQRWYYCRKYKII